MPEPAQLARFYEDSYSQDPTRAAAGGRWRALSAVGKADHVIALCARAGLRPSDTLEVGCGDGALLCELRRRGFGGRLSGLEISQAAVAIARERPEIDAVAVYDGVHLPGPDQAHALGVLSHVLEHVPDPGALLAELARACQAVVVEVPLEANRSARRRSKRAQSAEAGHLQRFDRRTLRRTVEDSGMAIVCELEDPLPLAVQRFFASTRTARAAATAKWALRNGLHRLAPPIARRLFTVHYACLCRPGA